MGIWADVLLHDKIVWVMQKCSHCKTLCGIIGPGSDVIFHQYFTIILKGAELTKALDNSIRNILLILSLHNTTSQVAYNYEDVCQVSMVMQQI